MTLQAAVDEMITVVGAITAVRAAYDDPPSSWGKGVYAAVYGGTGSAKIGPPEQMTTLDDVTIAVLKPLQDIAKDTALMLPLRDSVPMALFDALKDGTFTELDTFGEITHTFGSVVWAGVELFGFLFTVTDVKIRSTIT